MYKIIILEMNSPIPQKKKKNFFLININIILIWTDCHGSFHIFINCIYLGNARNTLNACMWKPVFVWKRKLLHNAVFIQINCCNPQLKWINLYHQVRSSWPCIYPHCWKYEHPLQFQKTRKGKSRLIWFAFHGYIVTHSGHWMLYTSAAEPIANDFVFCCSRAAYPTS